MLLAAHERERAKSRASGAADRQQSVPPNLLSQPFNDFGNALRFQALYGEQLRYCHAFNSWLVNIGTHWDIDRTDRARRLAQHAMLEFARQAMDAGGKGAARFAGNCLNSQRITAMLREAQPHLVVTPDQMDTNTRLLNFTNRTVDLRTGESREHRVDDLITKLIRHSYQPSASCPRQFLSFLQRIIPPTLQLYIQKAIGYSLTGETSEKAVFVCHGAGNNGKTTLLSLIRELLGEDYAVLLQIETLMVRQDNNNSQADLADLRGARFAMTSETEEGQRLSEGKLKRITQGMGKVKAVRKYENPIEFPETHKLWLDCNHKPVIRGTDQAIWNRLHLVPFGVTIPDDEIDRELPGKLIEGAEGIFAWAVAGAVRWYAEGLGKPRVVESAGGQWRSDSDRIGRFLGERCIVGETMTAKARPLYLAYRKWSDETGERVMPEVAFGNVLVERGFQREHTRHGNVYRGIAENNDVADGMWGEGEGQ